jgi:RES domain-containing protein
LIVYRIASSRYSANDGEGAKRHGGRWSHKGTAVVYAAQSASLCALEVLANSSNLPVACVLIQIQIPDLMQIRIVESSELIAGWDDPVPSDATREIGTNWIRAGSTAVLSVPSSIIQRERNYLLNPNHPEFARIRFGAPEPFLFDPRLK